ncbi:MAG: DUF3857 domain-containing protein [Kiritimatiellae bacterium]|nr:DUF3857 domain-containing protein [Kiritimatiellia bacterium]
MKKSFALFLFATTATFVAHAAASLDEQPAEVRRIALDDILAASAAVTPEAYPDADTVLLDSVTFDRYNPDGTSVTYDDTYIKVLTEKGRRDSRTDSLHFNVVYATNEIVAAEIIKPDGSVHAVDLARNSSIMIDPSSMDSNIYDPNDKILRVSYPGLEIGDIVRLAFHRTEYKVRVPDMWSEYQVFENFAPLLRYTYYVSAPDERPIRHFCLRSPVEGTVTNFSAKASEAGRTLHTWEIHNVPQAFPEPEMPALYTVAQRLLLSTAEDWQSLSKWYWNLCKPHLDATTPEMKDLVASIRREDAFATLRALFTWVSQNVRYMGVTTETEAPGYEPHDVSMTFDNRYGVCRDKAALLAAMLRLADIDAYPVLIHVGEKRDPEVPMTFFNHAIVGVRNADGSYTLMDPTNESAHDLLPAYLDDKSYLVAHPDGEDLHVSPITPASANMLRSRSSGVIDKDGTLSLETEISFEGLNDSVYRGHFARIPADKRRDFFDGLVKRRIAGATLEDFAIVPEDLQDTDTPLSVKMSVTARDFPAQGDNAVLVDLPWFSSSLGYVNFLIGETGLEKRRYPLETETACGVEEEISIAIADAGAPIALPEAISFSTNGVTFLQEANAEPDGSARLLRAKRRFELNLTEYPPEIYLGFKKALRDIEHAKDGRALFEPADTAAANADTRLLSQKIRYDIASPSCWTTTVSTVREILTYAGKKSYSEQTFSYNPVWQDVELLSATVSNAAGVVRSVQPHEINVMDQGWVASAPRYPAGKTMVISLPGVETGSVIRTSYRFVYRDAPFFSFSAVLQGVDPIVDYSVTVDAPTGLVFRAESFGSVREVSDTRDGRAVRSWSVSNPKTLPREEHLPPAFAYAASVYGSAGKWPDYAADVAAVLKKAISPEAGQEARAKARALCEGLASTPDKVRAVRDFVARDIRLAGPMFTELPLAASPADVTLSDGYGNALDRAALLVTMLDAIGLDSDVVLADPLRTLIPGTGATLDPRHTIPSPGVFTRPLVAVEPEAGHRVLLNDTDQYATLGVSPSLHHRALRLTRERITDDLQLDIDPAGIDPETLANSDFCEGDSLFIHLSPLRADFADSSRDDFMIDLDASGNALITVANTSYGTDAASVRRAYEEMTPEELSRHHQELVGGISVAARPAGPLEFDVTNYPAKVSYAVIAPEYAVRTGDTLTLVLPAPSPLVGLRSDKRTLPFGTSALDDGTSLISVVLPPETEEILLMPPEIDWSYMGFGQIRRKVSVVRDNDGGRSILTIKASRTNRFRTVLGPEFYPAILEMNRRLASPAQRTVVVRLASGQTNQN